MGDLLEVTLCKSDGQPRVEAVLLVENKPKLARAYVGRMLATKDETISAEIKDRGRLGGYCVIRQGCLKSKPRLHNNAAATFEKNVLVLFPKV